MANADQVAGLKPVMTIQGNPYSGNYIACSKAAGTTVTHDLFVGDPVILSGTADAQGRPGVVDATAGDGNQIFGVIVGFEQDPDNRTRGVWVDGADTGVVFVCADPFMIFEAQADDTIAVTDVGNNTNLVETQAGDRDTGKSGWEVDATVGTTITYQLKIIGFPNREDNTINSADNKVYVMINNHQLKNETGTTGI